MSASEFFASPKFATASTEQRLAALDKWAAHASSWTQANNPNWTPRSRAKETAKIQQMRRAIIEGKRISESAGEVVRDVGVSMAASGLSMAAGAAATVNPLLGDTRDIGDIGAVLGDGVTRILDRVGERRETTAPDEVERLAAEGFTPRQKTIVTGPGAAPTITKSVDRREKLDRSLAEFKAALDTGEFPEEPGQFIDWLKERNVGILREAARYNDEADPELYTDQTTRRFDKDLGLQGLLAAYTATRNEALFGEIAGRLVKSMAREQADQATDRTIAESSGVLGEIRDKGATLDGPLAGPLRALLSAEGISDAALDATGDPVELASSVVSSVLTGGTASAVKALGGQALGKATANMAVNMAVEAGTEAFQAYVEDSRGDIAGAAVQGGLVGLAFHLTGMALGGGGRLADRAFRRFAGEATATGRATAPEAPEAAAPTPPAPPVPPAANVPETPVPPVETPPEAPAPTPEAAPTTPEATPAEAPAPPAEPTPEAMTPEPTPEIPAEPESPAPAPDAGQDLMFEDRERGDAAPSSTGSRGSFSPRAARSGGNSIRDTGIPQGTEPRAFTLPALVQLSKAIGLDPTVNPKLKRALGRFVATRDAQGKVIPQSVETRAGLFRDPDLAIEVLAHEIGHFIDYTEAHLPRRPIHKRLAPLSKKNWESIFPTLAANYQGTPAKKLMAAAIRKEAVGLSEQWRGPFSADDKYRNSAEELYADFLSALLNAPQWTRRVAPNLYEGFFNGLNQKPTVQAAYREMQDLLSGDLVTDRVLQKLDEAHREGIGKVIDLARPDKVPLRERMRKNVATFRDEFLNRWGDVAAAEGQMHRAATGDSFTDQLEHNEGYAARQRSLFNDAIRQRVSEPLPAAGVEDAHFHRVLILNRIINDRRATGLWIENNPDDARTIMRWLGDRFNVSGKISDQIDTAADSSLYDVAARMMRELTDRGLDAETITKVENQALFQGDLPEDLEGRAAKFITAFNVRGFMLNTEGIDVETAREGLRKTRAAIGQAKWDAIQKAMGELFSITKPIVEHAIGLGIYGEGVANEVIRPNLGNYIPFQVLEYFDGDVSAAIKEGKGSTKALQDALTAISLNSQALLGWIQRQQTAMILEQFAKSYGMPVKDSGPITKFSGRLKSDDGDVVMIWRNGRPHALTFPEPGIAKAVNYFEELNFLAKLASEAGGIMGRLFTKYGPGFILYTNAFRDIQTQAERLGFRRTIRNAWAAKKVSLEYASAALGGPMSPEVRRLVEEGILPPPEQSIGRMLTESEIRDSINAGVNARDVAKGRVRAVKDTTLNRLIEAVDKPFVWLGAISESLGKIASEKSLQERGFDRKMTRKLAKLQGIPNPGLGGTSTRGAAAWSLFFRVIIQGYRAERTFLLNPQTRAGYGLRMTLTQVLPKVLMFAAATGALKGLLEGLGFDDPGDDLEEFYKSISQYKKEMGSVIPLFWLTPDGIEPVWGHTKEEIGNDWQAFGLRIPSSEGGRLWGSLTWNLLAESNDNTKSPDTARTWTRWATSQLPGLNPAIDIAAKNFQMAQGINPIDSFRNRPIINWTDWNAGGWDKLGAIASWNLSNLTGGFWRAETAVDTKGLSDVQRGIQQIAPLRSMLTMDNYRQEREQAIERNEKDRLAARTKKALGDSATELIAMGAKLESLGATKRTAAQEERYKLFLEFNRQYWEGKAGLRERLKQAVADGNEAEIETVREYLETGTEQYLGYIKAIR